MKLPFLLALVVTLASRALAAETALTLMPPIEPVAAGTPIWVDVVALNPSAHEASFDVESWMTGTLKSEAGTQPVTLRAQGNAPVVVSAGGFAARAFTLDVPADATGRSILEVKRRDGSLLRAVVDVSAKPAAVAAAPRETTPLDRLVTSAPASAALARNFAGRFEPNLPIYFLYGSGAQAVKFQFSFDYRVGTIVLGPPGNESIATVRAGFSQRSLWDTSAYSSPFYDTSYMPEISINTEARMPRDSGRPFTWLGLRSGFLHESNGKDGIDSRSLNIFYVRPRLVLGSLNGWLLLALPEVHAYLGDLADNPDLKDYRGYGRLRLYLGRNDGPSLMVSTWAGKALNHGTYQLDLAIPFHAHLGNLESFLYAQYFNGYGESLRAYQKKTDSFRAGFGLVR